MKSLPGNIRFFCLSFLLCSWVGFFMFNHEVVAIFPALSLRWFPDRDSYRKKKSFDHLLIKQSESILPTFERGSSLSLMTKEISRGRQTAPQASPHSSRSGALSFR